MNNSSTNNNKMQEATQMSLDKGIDKRCGIYRINIRK